MSQKKSVPPESPQTGSIVELASGVDALYLSGELKLPGKLLSLLESRRQVAQEARSPVPFFFGGRTMEIAPEGSGSTAIASWIPSDRSG